MFQDLIFFQDSDMSSYIGFQCFKISGLFQDLASMNKTLSISVGLNSHASCLSHTNCLSGRAKRVRNTTQKQPTLSLSVGRHGKLGQRPKQQVDISHRKRRYRPPQFGRSLLVWENSSAFPRLQRGRDYRSKAERHRTTSQKAQKLRIRRDCERKAKATCSR